MLFLKHNLLPQVCYSIWGLVLLLPVVAFPKWNWMRFLWICSFIPYFKQGWGIATYPHCLGFEDRFPVSKISISQFRAVQISHPTPNFLIPTTSSSISEPIGHEEVQLKSKNLFKIICSRIKFVWYCYRQWHLNPTPEGYTKFPQEHRMDWNYHFLHWENPPGAFIPFVLYKTSIISDTARICFCDQKQANIL